MGLHKLAAQITLPFPSLLQTGIGVLPHQERMAHTTWRVETCAHYGVPTGPGAGRDGDSTTAAEAESQARMSFSSLVPEV